VAHVILIDRRHIVEHRLQRPAIIGAGGSATWCRRRRTRIAVVPLFRAAPLFRAGAR